jgi:hypothetical protein
MHLVLATRQLHMNAEADSPFVGLVVNVRDEFRIQSTWVTINNKHWDQATRIPFKQLKSIKILQYFDKNGTSDSTTLRSEGETANFFYPLLTRWPFGIVFTHTDI